MYSPAKVTERIRKAQRILNRPLIHHTIPEIDEFEQRLRGGQKYIYDSAGVPIRTQNLSKEESQWIENEQMLMMCDHNYGLTRYCYVKSEEGIIERFKFRLAQQILFSIISDLQDQEAAIEILILKARQLGMSTVVELLIMLRIVFNRGVNAVVASADQDKSRLMSAMLLMAFDMLPCWMRPVPSARAEGIPGHLMFASLQTSLSVQHGNKKFGGIAQGWTPTVYHLSETALMPNPQLQIDAGLWKAVHASPAVFGVLESTGAGDQGWWADTWRFSKANWPTRSCRMCPLFLPWFVGRDLYPTKTWIRTRPVPEAFADRRLSDTRAHAAKAEAYVASQEMLRNHLGVGWRMPLDQQWFWEVGHEEAKSKGQESLWYQEMAGDDIEALQRSAQAIFPYEVIAEVNERRTKDYSIYGLCGQSIEDHHEPDPADIDYSRPRIPIVWRSPRGDSYSWELIPLQVDLAYIEDLREKNPEAFKDFSNGKLFIFEHPKRGTGYSMGIDTSNGQGQDSTVISVCSVGQRTSPDRQAAEFRSQFVSHVEAYAFAMCVVSYYSQFATAPSEYPKVAAEQLRAVGDTCQLQMRKMGYPAGRFHQFVRYDKKTINKAGATQLGWMTTGWSRPLLIDGFIHSVMNHWYQLNSPWTIYECQHFEQHLTRTGMPRPEHEEGEHDDGIFAAAISTFIAHDMDTMAERTAKRYLGPNAAGTLPPLDLIPLGSGLTLSTSAPAPCTLDDLL